MSVFCKKLALLRGSKSQKEFAEFLGITSQSTYHRLETGKTKPDSAELEMISQKCGVTIDWLLGRDKSKVPRFSISSENVEPKQEIKTLEVGDRTIRITPSAAISRMSDDELSGQIAEYSKRLLSQAGFDRVVIGMVLIEMVDEVISRSQFPKSSAPPDPPGEPGPPQAEK